MSVATFKTVILKPIKNAGLSTTNGGGILKIDVFKKTATLSLISSSSSKENKQLLILYCKESGFCHFYVDPLLKKQEFTLLKEVALCTNLTAFIVDISYSELVPIMQGSFGENSVDFKDVLDYAKSFKNYEEKSDVSKKTDRLTYHNEQSDTSDSTLSHATATLPTSATEQSKPTTAMPRFDEQSGANTGNTAFSPASTSTGNTAFSPAGTSTGGKEGITDYDDEAIAESNYFLNDNKGEGENATFYNQDDRVEHANYSQGAQEKTSYSSSGYEASPCHNKEQKEPKYYSSIKEKLLPLFEKYPPISALTAIIPSSNWVKIPYGENKHYAVGTVKEDNVVKYLCYGVPGVYGVKPKGFESYSYFIPLSLFNLLGEGYWCVFQEAESGKRVYRNTN